MDVQLGASTGLSFEYEANGFLQLLQSDAYWLVGSEEDYFSEELKSEQVFEDFEHD